MLLCRSAGHLAVVGFVALGLLTGFVRGHEAPDERIAALDAALARLDSADAAERAAILLRRAEQHRIARHWDLALADFERVDALAPERADDTAYLRACTELLAGRADDARATIVPLVERRPDHGPAHLVLAEALAAGHRPAAAAAAFEAAFARLPAPRPEAWLGRVDALMACTPPRTDAALACLDDGLAQLGPVVTLVRRAIEIESADGRHDAALARLDAFRRPLPRQERWLVERAQLLAAAQRPRDARRTLRDARAALAALPLRRRRTASMHELSELMTRLEAELETVPGDDP